MAKRSTHFFISKLLVIDFSLAKMTKLLFLLCNIVRLKGVRTLESVENDLSHDAEDTPITKAVIHTTDAT